MSGDSEEYDENAGGRAASYLSAISRKKLLTHAQEIECGKKIEASYRDALYVMCSYKNDGRPIPSSTDPSERPVQQGDGLTKNTDPPLPGLSALEMAVGYDDDETADVFRYAEKKILGARRPAKVRRASDILFDSAACRRCDLIRDALRHFRGFNSVPAEKKKEAGAHVRRAETVRNFFVESNLRLSVSISKRYARGSSQELFDLVQVGNIGLVRAVDRFDYRRGFRFSTYATWWIKHEISRYLQDLGRVIRLPVHAEEYLTKYRKCCRRLLNKTGTMPSQSDALRAMHGREPTSDDLLKLNEVLRSSETLSLDNHLPDDDETDFYRYLKDESAEDPLQRCMARERAEMLHAIIDDPEFLKPVQREVICRRYFISGGQTLGAVGDMYHVTRERIRQIQLDALGRIRRRIDAVYGKEFAEGK